MAASEAAGVLSSRQLAFIGRVMDHAFQATGEIWNRLPTRLRLPDSYIVFDLETTGFDPKEDLIIEVGWAIVQNRRVVDYAGMILDWTRFDPHNREFQEWLRWRLLRCRDDCAKQGRDYHFSCARLQREGVEPLQGLYDFAKLLWTFMDRGAWLVGHGARKFDRTRIDIATESFLEYKLPWHLSPILDTGLIEKASQLEMIPLETETIDEWYGRVDGRFARVKWNLDKHCAEKYNLAERFQLDLSLAHTAGFDCLLTWSLAETYRQIGEMCRGVEIA